MCDALSMILDDDFGLSDGDESDFEGEEVCGYLPECRPNLSVRGDHEEDAIEEDGEAMEVGGHSRLEEGVMDSDSSESVVSEVSYKVGEGEAGGFSSSFSSSAPSSGRGSTTLEMLSPVSSPEPSTGGEVDSQDSDSSGSVDGDMGMTEGEDEDVGGGEDEGVGGGGGMGEGGGVGGGEDVSARVGGDVLGLLDRFHRMRRS